MFREPGHTVRCIVRRERPQCEPTSVPEDVSVVGFDNVPQSVWPSFNLTTIQQDVDRMVDATRTLLFAGRRQNRRGARRSLSAGRARLGPKRGSGVDAMAPWPSSDIDPEQ